MQPISSNYRSTPPSSAVQVNRGNPIARGLQRAWFASTGIDHVSGIPAVNSSTTHNVPGQNQLGATLRCSGAQSMESYTVPHITAMDGGSEFTVFAVSTTNSGAERPLAGVWGASGARQFYLAINSSRNPLVAVTNGATNRIETANLTTVPAGVRVTVAGGWRSSGDTCRIWVNGSPVTGTRSGSAISAMPTVSNPVSIAAQGPGASVALSGDIELVLIFNRLLSDAEIRSLSDNPYQILRPANDRLWLDVVAGGGGVTGTLAATDSPDAASVSGSASAPSASGALSASDAQDIASFAGALIFSGSLSATDSPDAATLAGTAYAPGVSGTLAATDNADAAGLSGALSFVGALSAVESQDSAAVAGAFGPSGSLAAADLQDSAAFFGICGSGVDGLLVAVDQPDSAVFSGVADNAGLAIAVSHRRVLIVPPQSRSITIAAESRTLTIAPQSRVLTIQGE